MDLVGVRRNTTIAAKVLFCKTAGSVSDRPVARDGLAYASQARDGPTTCAGQADCRLSFIL